MSKYIIDLRPDCKVVQQICAIDKGINIGSRSIGLLDELTDDYVKKNFKDLLEGEYQRGFEDGVTKRTDGDACAGCEYKGKTGEHLPCEYCMNNFTNQWKPKDVQFEFGDEIIDSNGVKGCVISMNNEKSDTMYALFGGYRVPQCICQKNYRKTGKHYDVDDIKKLLEDMRHD